MKKTLMFCMLLVGFGVFTPSPLLAQDDAKPAGVMDTNKDGKVDADETKTEIDKDVDVGDVASEVGAVVDAAQDLKGGKAAVIMMFLSVLFKLMLSAVKLIKKETNWFHAKKAKRIIKYSTLGLGGLAALMSNLAFGVGWMEAGIIFLSGPVAVAIHEYTKDSKDGDPDA